MASTKYEAEKFDERNIYFVEGQNASSLGVEEL